MSLNKNVLMGIGRLGAAQSQSSRQADSSETPPKDSRKHILPDVPVGEHHGGSFRLYMKHKNERLNYQFNEENPEIVKANIFTKMTFFINGHTQIPIEELRSMIRRHGGIVLHQDCSAVTHILCTHLPHTKLRQRHEQKLARGAHQQKPIIHPDFVVDSINRGRALDTANYLIEGIKNHHGSNIQRFFSPSTTSCGPPNTAASKSELHVGSPIESLPIHSSTPQTTPIPQPVPPSKAVAAPGCLSASVLPPEDKASVADDWHCTQTSVSEALGQEGHISTSQATLKDEDDPMSSGLQSSQSTSPSRKRPRSPSPVTATTPEKAQATLPAIGAAPSPPTGSSAEKARFKGAMMTSKEDPAFIRNYFGQSRLHFIGRFRGRVRELAAQRERQRRAQAPLPQECEIDSMATQHTIAAEVSQCESPAVLHVDLDCFFVSALVRDRPDLVNRPLVVAHSDTQQADSCSEVSSCNYPARQKGVRNGMWLGEARQCCPDLVVLPYDFQAYERVSLAIYNIFFDEAQVVQAVSLDEAFLQLALGQDGMAVASKIRRRIMEQTGCPASAGVSINMLLARLATKQAKPNGHYLLRPEAALEYLEALDVRELPGVGHEMGKQLDRHGIHKCGQLRSYPLLQLQDWFGKGTGQMLHDYSRGVDHRQLTPETARKSIGAEVNWGVRFSQDEDVADFVKKLAGEVACRMVEAKVKGRHMTFKLKRSRYGPAEPSKMLGHGDCDNISRSYAFPRPTSSGDDIGRQAVRLLRQIECGPKLLRGVGIQMTKLESHDIPETAQGRALSAWLKGKADSQMLKGQEAAEVGQDAIADDLGAEGAEDVSFLTEEDLPCEGREGQVADIVKERTDAGGQLMTVPDSPPIGSSIVDDADVVAIECMAAPPAKKPLAPLAAAAARPGPSDAAGWDQLTMSQVDGNVLSELPSSVQQEIKRVLQPHRIVERKRPLGPKAGTKEERRRQLTMQTFELLRGKNLQGIDPFVFASLPVNVQVQVMDDPAYQDLTKFQRLMKYGSAQAADKTRALESEKIADRKLEALEMLSESGEEGPGADVRGEQRAAQEARGDLVAGGLGGGEETERFFRGSTLEEVRREMLSWLQGITGVGTEEIKKFRDFLMLLVAEGKEDWIWFLLRAAQRMASRDEISDWIREVRGEVEQLIRKREVSWERRALVNSSQGEGMLSLAGL